MTMVLLKRSGHVASRAACELRARPSGQHLGGRRPRRAGQPLLFRSGSLLCHWPLGFMAHLLDWVCNSDTCYVESSKVPPFLSRTSVPAIFPSQMPGSRSPRVSGLQTISSINRRLNHRRRLAGFENRERSMHGREVAGIRQSTGNRDARPECSRVRIGKFRKQSRT